MNHHQEPNLQRLGLLLAGGGARCRRLVARLAADEPPLPALRGGSAPQALLTAARHLAGEEARQLLDRLAGSGWRWLTPAAAEYPRLLGQSSDPPLGLFVRGSLPGHRLVAIVGSRQATPYGRQVARLLGEEMARAGVAVVSGMARGIDAAAHQGSLDGGGPTVAVWGTGPDQVYPEEHRSLAEAIAANGALVTEYPPGTPPRRHRFPERNRIIAAMTPAVVIVEAGVRSGALITARLALEEDREVLAVPGSIFSEQSIGPNALLRSGARPLLSAADLLEDVGGQQEVAGGAEEETDRGLLSYLCRGEAVTVDDLAERSGLGMPQLLSQLLELELAAAVERLDDGRYSRR